MTTSRRGTLDDLGFGRELDYQVFEDHVIVARGLDQITAPIWCVEALALLHEPTNQERFIEFLRRHDSFEEFLVFLEFFRVLCGASRPEMSRDINRFLDGR